MALTQIVPVEIPGAGYDIRIEFDLLHTCGRVLRDLSAAKKIAIITDSHVGPHHALAVAASLRQAGFEATLCAIPAGEENKTFEHLLPVYDQLLSSRIDRKTPVIALGGGVIGDMAGFIAGTILRGVPFIQMPTSLLAMVDASVGGKTGIDHARGKNLIGVFHQPITVLIDPNVLRTLPPRELRNGLAECIKHEIIRDSHGFAELETNLPRALAGDLPYIAQLVGHNVAIKARVVADDPLEQGQRAHLNLGHTFGHAIESMSNYEIAHGQAVALGMCAAAYTAEKLGLLTKADHDRIRRLIASAQLPTGGLKLDAQHVVDAMIFDKKVEAGKIRLVLPHGIGQAVIRDDVPVGLMLEAVSSLQADHQP
ncbi:MAG: 3-dehydroquinate synthase [Phycisphaerales bacterium]|nr:3-dehydroquinate synthase [Phycisphaerales bacterium]